MLTKRQLAKFEAVVKKELSKEEFASFVQDFDPDEPSVCFETDRYYTSNKDTPDDDVEINFKFANDLQELHNCCGILELGNLYLERLEPLRIACFALWLHQGFKQTAIVATTAQYPAKSRVLSAEEKVLKQVGFIPTIRGINGGSGNLVTMWVFQTSKPAMLPQMRRCA